MNDNFHEMITTLLKTSKNLKPTNKFTYFTV